MGQLNAKEKKKREIKHGDLAKANYTEPRIALIFPFCVKQRISFVPNHKYTVAFLMALNN